MSEKFNIFNITVNTINILDDMKQLKEKNQILYEIMKEQ